MIYVPAVPSMLHPRTVPAILADGYQAQVVPVDGSLFDYTAWFVRWWWLQPEGFTIVEHDVEATPGLLAKLGNCPEPWCCNPYNDSALLGFTRWRPDLLSGADPAIAVLFGTVAWHRLDMAVFDALTAAGYEPHVHEGRAIHHHVYG